MIESRRGGDVTRADVEAMVNTVNCVGAMGRGVALAVKNSFPAVYAGYRRDCGIGLSCSGTPDRSIGPGKDQSAPRCCMPGSECEHHRVRPGSVILRATGRPGLTTVVDFPTKRHWNAPSLLADVLAGLPALAEAVRTRGFTSIAVPPLGCGNGGLDWREVRPHVVAALAGLDCRIVLFDPA